MEHSGIIVSFSEKSGHGIASFQLKGKEEKAYFELENTTVDGSREPVLTLDDRKIIVGMEAKLLKCILLTEDDLPVGQHRNTTVRYKTHIDIKETAENFAKILHTNNEMKGKSYSGVIKTLTKGSGIVTFLLEGNTEKASFHQAHANVDGIPVPRYLKLHKVFQSGMEAILTNVQRLYEGNDPTIKYRCYVNVLGSTENYALRSLKTVPLCRRMFCGTVESLSESSGIVSFQLYEQDQQAFFYKTDTSVAGKPLAKGTSLGSVVTVGQDVTLSFVERLQLENPQKIVYKGQVNIDGATNGHAPSKLDASDSTTNLKRQREEDEEANTLEATEKKSRTSHSTETASVIPDKTETSSDVQMDCGPVLEKTVLDACSPGLPTKQEVE